MHIPDGYLSPSTCATLYAGAIAGWYAALKRVKRLLLSRVVPLISVFAAFAFVVMMFNLPLPGGTTGHALGVTIAAIVLGSVGGNPRHLHCPRHSGAVLRRRRNQHAGSELLQHGNCGFAGRLWKLPADRSRFEHRVKTQNCGSRNRWLSRRERRSPGCRDRVWNSARALSRCGRNAAVRAVSIERRTSRHVDRAPDLRGLGGGCDLCRTCRLPASCRPGSAAKHIRNSGGQGRGAGNRARCDELTAAVVDCRGSPHAADASGNSGGRQSVGRMVALRIRQSRITSRRLRLRPSARRHALPPECSGWRISGPRPSQRMRPPS